MTSDDDLRETSDPPDREDRSPRDPSPPRRRSGVALRLVAGMLLAIGLMLAGLEHGLRAFWKPARSAYVWPPGLDSVHVPDPAILPGIEGDSRFHVGSHGLRGSEVEEDATLRILAIGGSTTECLFLDQAEAWPALLESRLAERTGPGSVWIGNAGRSGHTTREHRLQVEELCASLPGLDLVIVLAGINDLGRRLAHEHDYDSRYFERPDAALVLRRTAFALLPVGEITDGSWPNRSSVARLLKFAELALRREQPGFDVRTYDFWRRNRAGVRERRETLPDLEPALLEFASNVRAIVAIARARGQRVVFSTQPVLWSAGLAPASEALLWMGGVGDFQKRPGSEYYSAAALARGMEAYNRVLVETCAREGVACVDLAARLAGRADAFYDDCHFTEEGARTVAAAFAEHPALAR